MTQSILKALMRLFAIVSHIYASEDIKSQKQIIESFLRLFVRDKEVYQYCMMYDFYLKSLQQKDKILTEKKISRFSVKTLIICEEINHVLEKNQKVIVLLYLIEIAYLKHEKTIDKEYLRTISRALKIITADFENTLLFVLNRYTDILNNKKLLLIANSPIPDLLHQIVNENLQGKIIVLQYKSSNTYVFRYINGNDNLYLNNKEIVPDRSYIFEKGSSIQCPKISPIYYSDIVRSFLRDETLHDLNLSADNIEFHFRKSDNGIQNMKFSANSGQLIGIMGGSGVGKSTFLNVLNGSLKPNAGHIYINGFDIHLETEKTMGLIGFISQDDLLIEELTVYQNLYYNARLCFRDLSLEEIENLVNKTLSDLELFNIKDLIVGSPLKKFISGGQRKRLNIALELIREPSILLVDEPTSGLSSRDSENVMELFKEQALKGKIVIINIHQPSSDIFKKFDKILIFDEGGRPVYFGNPVESVVYFKSMTHLINATESECLSCGNVNPEQILEIIELKNVNEYGVYTEERKVKAEEWYTMYKKNIESDINVSDTKMDLPTNRFHVPELFEQFKIFTLRNILTKLSDKQFLFINFLEAPILALILGFFTKHIFGTVDNPDRYIFGENENIPAYLFMSIVVALFLGMMVSAEEIIRDRKILKRESFLHLSWNSYLNSKILILFVISAIQTLTFVLIGNMMLDIRGMYLSYWLVLFSVSCFANMLGLNISASMKSVVTIYITIPLLLVPQILFAGVIVKFDKLHKSVTSQEVVPIIGDLMASRWAYEGLAVHQFKNNKYEKLFYKIEKKESDAAFKMNYHVPEIITKVYFCKKYHNDLSYRSVVSKELETIRKEIIKLQNNFEDKNFSYIGSLNISSFNSNVANYTIKYLNEIKLIYSQVLESSIYAKDNLVIEIMNKTGGKEKFFEFKQQYYNNSIADQVLSKIEKQKITEAKGKLIQKAEPVFKYPEKNNGRAHFYSPVKKISGIYLSTLTFNLCAIWFMTILLYLTVQFNFFTLLLDFIKKINLLSFFSLKKLLNL